MNRSSSISTRYQERISFTQDEIEDIVINHIKGDIEGLEGYTAGVEYESNHYGDLAHMVIILTKLEEEQ